MKILTNAQAAQFLQDGYVVVEECFSRETAAGLVEQFWDAAPLQGVQHDDRATWTHKILLIQQGFEPKMGGPIWTARALGALDDLLGEGRYSPPRSSGWPLLNFPGFAAPPWSPPSDKGGWHIDGIHFHHHVHSREQGLIGLLMFTDVAPGGGGTAVKPGSHHITSRILRDAEPEGLHHEELTRRVAEATTPLPAIEVRGGAGAMLFMHPHLYHASSPNCSEMVRIASNSCIALHEPMDLNRPDAGAYSLVEQTVVAALTTE